MHTRPVREQKPTGERERVALAEWLSRTFVNRWEWYAFQTKRGEYVAVHEPLTRELILRHLEGSITLGVYALNAESRAKWLCLDADSDAQRDVLLDVAQRLAKQGAPSYIEDSRRGAHLWMFFAEPLEGRTVRALARALLPPEETIEIYPKQDALGDGPGSLVRLPLGIHRLSGRRYGIHLVGTSSDPQGQPPPLVGEVRTIPTAFVASTLAEATIRAPAPPETRPVVLRPAHGGPSLIEQIKASIDAYDFISQYVQLGATGKGRCPFHDDQRASFSVHRERGFWQCFAGCGAGDVIHFWEKYRKLGRREAVRDLAHLLRGTGGLHPSG